MTRVTLAPRPTLEAPAHTHWSIEHFQKYSEDDLMEDVFEAGLSVVIGGLMHSRPNYFAKVMGELLFWVGEDKMTFGSDYGIWEPKWQVEGLVDWDYPSDEFSDYPRVSVATKKKILGLNAAKLYDIEVPVELRRPAAAGTPGAQDDAQLVEDPVGASA